MRLSRCEKGHFYDKEKYDICPLCNEDMLMKTEPENLFSEVFTETTGLLQQAPPAPPLSKSVPLNNLSSGRTQYPLWDDTYTRFIEDVEKLKQETVELSTCVYDVELFRSIGQIRRKGVFKPTEKCTKVIILDLPEALREDSIHLLADKGLVSRKMTIFRYHCNYEAEIKKFIEEDEKLLENAQPLFDELKMCELKMESLFRYIKVQSKKTSAHQDYWENVLFAEKEWNKLADERNDLQKRCNSILTSDIELKRKKKELEYRKKTKYGLSLELVAEPGRAYGFHLDYVVNHVGWSPRYDIRTYTQGAEMQLVLQADIYQDSGEDWNDVRIKLTTENDLPTSDAAFITPQKITLKTNTERTTIPTSPMPTLAIDSAVKDELTTAFISDNISEPDFNSMPLTEEDVALKQNNPIQCQYTIDSAVSMRNNAACTLVLTKKSLQVKKLFFAIPKKECNEYMGVFAEEFKNEKLLDCPVRVYVDDTYSTMLKTETLRESGIVVLGRAHGVTLQRRIRTDEENSKKLSGQKEIYQAYEIEVENEMDEPAKILVTDQIPISLHEAVTVSNVNVGDGTVDDAGICRWDIVLEPHEKIVLPVEYIITYPQKEELVWS